MFFPVLVTGLSYVIAAPMTLHRNWIQMTVIYIDIIEMS